MSKLIIFGTGEQAEVANYYFANHTDYSVEAFSVDKDYIKEERYCGKPIVPFGDLASNFSPKEHKIFVAVGYSKLNLVRKTKCNQSKEMGYDLASYISTKANIFTDRIGEHAFILEDNTIQPFVIIGNNVTIWSGNHIGHHSIIEDDCFITSHAVIAGSVRIGERSFVGINATVFDHIIIGKETTIGAGAVIKKNTEAGSVYAVKGTERLGTMTIGN